jgi:hypothetical protein
MKNTKKEQETLLSKQRFVNEIKDTYSRSVYRFIHLTSHKLNEIKDRENFLWSEPRGIHYAIDFVRFYEGDYGERYMYGLAMKAKSEKDIYTTIDKPDINKVLLLKNKQEYEVFKSMYLPDQNASYVDDTKPPEFQWDKFVEQFGGIEWRGSVAWEFDVKWPGYGCITNMKLVKQLVLIASRKHGVKQWSLTNVTQV